MSVRIRLKRMGAKKRPFYRIVVADSRASRDGRFIETLGYYDPITEPKTVKVDAEKYRGWIKNGAQPSESVAGVLKRSGALDAPSEAPAPVAATAPAVAPVAATVVEAPISETPAPAVTEAPAEEVPAPAVTEAPVAAAEEVPAG